MWSNKGGTRLEQQRFSHAVTFFQAQPRNAKAQPQIKGKLKRKKINKKAIEKIKLK